MALDIEFVDVWPDTVKYAFVLTAGLFSGVLGTCFCQYAVPAIFCVVYAVHLIEPFIFLKQTNVSLNYVIIMVASIAIPVGTFFLYRFSRFLTGLVLLSFYGAALYDYGFLSQSHPLIAWFLHLALGLIFAIVFAPVCMMHERFTMRFLTSVYGSCFIFKAIAFFVYIGSNQKRNIQDVSWLRTGSILILAVVFFVTQKFYVEKKLGSKTKKSVSIKFAQKRATVESKENSVAF